MALKPQSTNAFTLCICAARRPPSITPGPVCLDGILRLEWLVVFQDSNPANGTNADEEPTFIFTMNLGSKIKNNTCTPTTLSGVTQIPTGLTAVTHGVGDGAGTFLAMGIGLGCRDENEFARELQEQELLKSIEYLRKHCDLIK